MPCYHPKEGWLHSNGGRVLFSTPVAGPDVQRYRRVFIPCRKCAGCRETNAREWAIRCVHEAKMARASCFITLTYDRAHVPRDGVSKRHWQLFMKRLRKRIAPVQIRFFMAAEYGTINGRPHYHAVIFGYEFEDRTVIAMGKSGLPQFQSKLLEEVWGMGRCTWCELNEATAGYCARYQCKEGKVPPGCNPEFCLASRKPGLGLSFLEKFESDMYRSDGESAVVFAGGRESMPPTYYDRKIREKSERRYELLKAARAQSLDPVRQVKETGKARLAVRERVDAAIKAHGRVPRGDL